MQRGLISFSPSSSMAAGLGWERECGCWLLAAGWQFVTCLFESEKWPPIKRHFFLLSLPRRAEMVIRTTSI